MLGKELGIKRYFYVQRLVFNAIGIDVTAEDKIMKQPYRFFIPFICINSMILCMLYYIFNNLQKEKNEAIDSLNICLQGILGAWKISLFVYNRKTIVLVVRRILLLTEKATQEERHIIAEENSKDKYFSYFYSISVVMAATTFLVAPIIILVTVYLRSGKYEFLPPFKASYPIDQNQPLNYLLIYCCNCASIYIVTFGSAATETLFSWLVHNIAAQFRIIQLKLKAAAVTNLEVNETEVAIKRCIRQHQCAITLADDFNRSFQSILFVEYVVSCVQLCLIAYRLSSGLANEGVPFLIIFLSAAMMQMVIYCYGGQRVQDESELIVGHIYEDFSWHLISVRDKKLLQQMMMRAQKSCTLKGVFFTANWSLFIWVVRTNASFVTLLWSMDDKAAVKH